MGLKSYVIGCEKWLHIVWLKMAYTKHFLLKVANLLSLFSVLL